MYRAFYSYFEGYSSADNAYKYTLFIHNEKPLRIIVFGKYDSTLLTQSC